ncbi:type II toxin-antitoxin system RelE/ParE family toxin [Salegentibacter sp. JZCK2]|uniref:type II toxin-antitoxin system RelE/ParE family toxin n=1 Tax=Salegentibacter tibetensis TaxID=2873600 RepID=UPI001CC9285C|nr:type II toxin-antitoxin system RelE/ParE family toxin [Salegentibacter tibetensis]MBZ9729507.1 type II toxin-antitoxin system RelE/ParE family toxin [Salegentibacter tibetensis]
MKSGYKILWTDHALSELNDTIEYLEKKWTERELKNFSRKLDHTIELISKNPELFQVFKKNDVRRAVVAKFNNLCYRVNDDTIEILSIFSNRQDPDKIKI